MTFITPVAVPRAVHRARLIRQLNACSDRMITLVCAPPGTGKSTLVADWISGRRDVAALWLNLDARANERDVLFNDLARGLHSVGRAWSVQGAGLVDRLTSPPSPGSDVVVVLDDAQEVVDRQVWLDLQRLAAASPSWLRWVIITRVDPPLSLQRLQLQGRLAQIRVADLAFDVAEAAELMRWFGLDLQPETLSGLVRWSEGWVSALCLAARTMLSGAVSRPWEVLDVSQPLVLDLLLEEVLERLNPVDRRFLLQISAADMITPELAAELTGTAGAGERLRRLERSGTFLLEVDPIGSHYRFHRLMSTLLRVRLNDEMPAEGPELMTSAAHWYDEHGFHDEAERHAVRGKDWNLVGRLRARRFCERLLHTGSIQSTPGIAQPGTATEPTLYLLAVADAIRRGDRRAADHMLQRGADIVDEAAAASPLLRCLLAHEYARWVPTGPAAHVGCRSERTRSATGEEAHSRSAFAAYLMIRRGETLLAAGDTHAGRRCLEEIAQLADAPEWPGDQAAAIIAVLDAAAGDPQRATAMSRDRPRRSSTDADSWLHVAAAVAHGLHGEATGLRQRTEALVFGRDGRRSWLFEQCTKLLTAAVNWRSTDVTPLAAAPPPGLPTTLAIALGVVETVDREGHTHSVGGPLERVIAEARHVLVDGSSRRLSQCLAPWCDRSTVGQHPRSIVELNVLLAISALRQEREDLAFEHVGRALEQAAGGLWAPFIAHADHLRGFFANHGRDLGADNPTAITLIDSLRADEEALMAPLTDRERAVLHYLPTLMSNSEIAAEMLVSVNTVKSHLKAIYRKLGVDRRRDAVMRARQIELL